MKRKKIILLTISLIVTFFVIALITFHISRSRTFQFFGGLTTRVETDKKIVALTFDDGPTEKTPEVLEIMKKENIKATFYLVGNEMEQQPQITKDIVAAGHEVGNHSYSHQRMAMKTPSFYRHEVDTTNTLIRDAGYKGEITFRPPYSKKLVYLPWYLNKLQIKTVMWDVEPETYVKTKEDIVNNIVENTKPGSIILLHPHYEGNEESRSALPEIIRELKKQGYTFVTVSELLKYK